MKTYSARLWAASILSLTVIGAALSIASPAWADPITDANVTQHIADAKTAAAHQQIAAYYRAKAAEEGERVKFHEAMLAQYQKSVGHQVGKPYQQMVDHCKTLISLAKQSQSTYLEMANMHDEAAKGAAS